MKYEIRKEGNSLLVASFLYQHDRDLCFDFLNEDNDLIKRDGSLALEAEKKEKVR